MQPLRTAIPQALAQRAVLTRFFWRAVPLFLVLTGLWWPVADYTSKPAAYVASVALETLFPYWVRHTSVLPRQVEVETRLTIMIPQNQARPGAAPQGGPLIPVDLVAGVDPSKYGYSLPLLLALLLAGSRRKLLRHAVIGALFLVPFHAFSIVATMLKDLAVGTGPAITAQMALSQGQLELIAFCYQLGVLLLPTLVPILLWVWLDRRYAHTLMMAPPNPTAPTTAAQAPATSTATSSIISGSTSATPD